MNFPALASIILLSVLLPARADSLPTQPMDTRELPPLPFSVDGGFVVMAGGMLVAAGSDGEGMRLWTAPADGMGEWRQTTMAVPSHAAAAAHGDGLVIVGGIGDGGTTDAVTMIEFDGDGEPSATALAALPEPLAAAGAAVVGGTLHVLGGARSLEPLEPVGTLLLLDLDGGDAWQRGPGFPGAPRAFAAVAEQYDTLCVFGGRGPSPLADAWSFRPEPLEGTAERGWKRLGDLPQAAPAAAAVALGQAQVALFGLPGGQPLLHHVLTDAWCAFDAVTSVASPVAAGSAEGVFVLGTGPDGNPAAEVSEIPENVRKLAWQDYLLIAGYFIAISLIGLYFSGKQESSEEFSLGNRRVVWWAAGISMFATAASAISFMAIPALAFATNLVWLFPIAAMVPAFFVTAYLIYPLLRRIEITSTYEYLERRFNVALRLIASFQCIVFQTLARASVVLVLPALAVSAVTGIDVHLSVVIMGVITTIYTALGGFEAVIWTEVLQGALMLLAPLAIIFVAISSLPGGFGEFMDTNRAFGKFDFAVLSWDLAVPAFWILLVSTFLSNTVSHAGDQPVVQRVFSAPLKEVRKVNLTFTACGILIAAIVNVMGLAIFAYFHARPEQLVATAQNDQVVPLFVVQAMPTGMAGLVVAGIFAASMSTVASAMNSVATVFTEDFYSRIKPSATDAQRLFMLRAVSYAVGIIGTITGLLLVAQDLKSMMVVWTQFTALLGGGIVGVYSLGMFTRRANGFGAVCGALASIAITGAVKLFTDLHWGTYVPIAIFSCIIVGYVASLLRPQGKDISGLTVFTATQPSADRR